MNRQQGRILKGLDRDNPVAARKILNRFIKVVEAQIRKKKNRRVEE